jgi:hypothetical protein
VRLYWTRERVVASIQEWVALYGEPPSSYEWNPSDRRRARKPSRYTSTRYPHTAIVVRRFGSWRNAITTARQDES